MGGSPGTERQATIDGLTRRISDIRKQRESFPFTFAVCGKFYFPSDNLDWRELEGGATTGARVCGPRG
jgi:hypothetical protein